MCDDCKHKETCAALGIMPSVAPRKEACFEPEVSHSMLQALVAAHQQSDAVRYISNSEIHVRV